MYSPGIHLFRLPTYLRLGGNGVKDSIFNIINVKKMNFFGYLNHKHNFSEMWFLSITFVTKKLVVVG